MEGGNGRTDVVVYSLAGTRAQDFLDFTGRRSHALLIINELIDALGIHHWDRSGDEGRM
jgi:hypothetical protein